MRDVFRVDRKPISTSQAIRPRKFTSVSTTIVRSKVTLTDTTPTLLSYVREFEEDFGVPFVVEAIANIAKDVMSLHFLAAISRAIFIHCITAGKMIVEQQGVLQRPTEPVKDASAAKIPGITNLDNQSLYISSEENIFFMIQAADPVFKNEQKLASFHAKKMIRLNKSLFEELSFVN